MIEIRSYKDGDFDRVKQRECYTKEDTLLTKKADKILPDHVHIHTLMDSETKIPIAIFGGHLHWKGVIRVWGYLGEDVNKYPIEFHKKSKALLSHYERMLGIHRTETCVRCDYKPGVRWAEGLGFKVESTLKNFGNDKSDFYMFVRLF